MGAAVTGLKNCCDRDRRTAKGEHNPSVETARAFDEAVIRFEADGDVSPMVKLVGNFCKLPQKDMGEASEDKFAPRTIGALACQQIAIWAKDENNVPAICEAGGLAALLGQTRENSTPDRRQAALLALCYLSNEDPENCEEMYEDRLMNRLEEWLHMPSGHFRSCVETCLVSICGVVPDAAEELFARGGALTMLRNLDQDASMGQKADRRYLVEAVENMHDLLTDIATQQIRPDFARQMVNNGLLEVLDKLEDYDDDDVATAVADLRAELGPFEKDAKDGPDTETTMSGTTLSRN